MHDAGRRRERMSRVDTAWLRMDNDVNLMMIVGVWLLGGRASIYERLRARVENAADVPSASASRWCAMRPAQLLVGGRRASTSTHHVRAREACRGQAASERAALQELVGELAYEPLDPARPLWQFHLIDNYEGGSALIARIHHCIADGIALISRDAFDDDHRRRQRARRARAGARRRRRAGGDWLADAVISRSATSPSRRSA